MNKKAIIIGAIIIAAISSTATYAAMQSTHVIFEIERGSMQVSTFWHDGNRCYVSTGNAQDLSLDQTYTSAISCVRYK